LIYEKSNDEIGLLAESFNEMSRKMADDIEQLRSVKRTVIRTENSPRWERLPPVSRTK
jgi:methyl-accepting chemotaxis protein